jgi:hypothetical protein
MVARDTRAQDTRKGQYISKKTCCQSNEAVSGWSSLRFAQGQALSETKDLARRTEILRFTQDDQARWSLL